VFRALTDPDELARWWGSPEVYQTHDWKLDLRPGGQWSCQARSAKGTAEVRGEVLAVDPPRLLEVSWEPSWEEFRRSIIRYTLERVPGGTRLSVFHRGLPSEESTKGHGEGWNRVLGWLVQRLSGTGATRSSV
jgi:uncharacterized protein YndB with AHSA1/START domain